MKKNVSSFLEAIRETRSISTRGVASSVPMKFKTGVGPFRKEGSEAFTFYSMTSAVKQGSTVFVLGWVTTWEDTVL